MQWGPVQIRWHSWVGGAPSHTLPLPSPCPVWVAWSCPSWMAWPCPAEVAWLWPLLAPTALGPARELPQSPVNNMTFGLLACEALSQHKHHVHSHAESAGHMLDYSRRHCLLMAAAQLQCGATEPVLHDRISLASRWKMVPGGSWRPSMMLEDIQ